MKIEQFNNAAFNDVVLALQPSARRLALTDFNEWLLAVLKPHLRFDTALIGIGDVDNGVATVNSVHLHRLPDVMMVEYEKVRDRDPAARAATVRIGGTANLCMADEATDPELQAYIEKYGFNNALCTAIVQPRIGMSLFMTREGEPS